MTHLQCGVPYPAAWMQPAASRFPLSTSMDQGWMDDSVTTLSSAIVSRLHAASEVLCGVAVAGLLSNWNYQHTKYLHWWWGRLCSRLSDSDAA